MTTRNWPFGVLEGKAPMLFLAAGGLFVVFAALMGYQALIDSSVNLADNEADFFGPAGWVFGFLGLLRLYPTMADRSPNLARIGAASAAVGILGAAVIALGTLATLMGVLSGPPAWAAILSLGILVGMLGGYPVFGVESLRTGVHSRTVALLLLVPVAIFVVMLSGGLTVIMDDAVARFVLASGQALSHLALGVALKIDTAPAASEGADGMPAEIRHG